jgi:hypothetical protein
VSDDIAFLMTAPNEPMARYWEDVLVDAGIPVREIVAEDTGAESYEE